MVGRCQVGCRAAQCKPVPGGSPVSAGTGHPGRRGSASDARRDAAYQASVASSTWYVARLQGTTGARHQLLDAQLGVADEPLAASLERDAALVQGEGRLERLAAGLELGDDPLQLGEGIVEGERLDARGAASGIGSVVATGLLGWVIGRRRR